MAEKNSTKLYGGATPLGEAWKKYASPEERAALNEVPSVVDSLKGRAAQEDYNPSISAFLGDIAAMYFSKTGSLASLENELKDKFIARVVSGEFELLGIRIVGVRKSAPVKITGSDLMKYSPDWIDEAVEIRGERFADLRVSPSSLRPGKKPGRKGSADLAREAIRQLNIGDYFQKTPRKVACHKIREHLKSAGCDVDENTPGFSSANLSNLIREQCGLYSIAMIK